MNLRALFVSLVMGSALSFSAGVQAATELNASIWFPESQPLTKFGYQDWAKKVEEVSDGELRIRVFTDTTLLPVAAHFSGLRDGIADITYHAGTYTPSDLPEDNVLAILGITFDDDMQTAFAVADFYINDEDMQALWNRQNMVFLGAYASVPYNLICRTEVAELADLKGLKLRSPGPVHSEWARSVGATPVNVPSSEMFNGLDKGQIDCAIMGANELKTRSLWDVAKYVNMANLGPYYSGWLWAMNKNSWANLSEEERQILLDTIAESSVETQMAYPKTVDQAIDEAEEHRVKVIEPSADIVDAIESYSVQAREMAIKEGKERFNLQDPEGLIDRFMTTYEKWGDLLDGVDRDDKDALVGLLRENLYDGVDVSSYGN